jgi:hypothetical protein
MSDRLMRSSNKLRLDAVEAIPFASACVLCTVFGWFAFGAAVLSFGFRYDSGHGETDIACFEGAVIGLAIPVCFRIVLRERAPHNHHN